MTLRFREQDAEVEHRLEQRGAVPAFELISTGCTSGMATISSGPYTFATTLLSPASSSSSVPSGSGMGRLGASCSEGVQMSLEPVEMTGLEGAPLHNPSLVALQGQAVCVPCGEGHMAQTEEQPSPLLTPVQTPRWGTLVHWGDTWGCGHGVIWGGGYTCDGRQHGGRRWATERVRGVCREQGACRVSPRCTQRDRVLRFLCVRVGTGTSIADCETARANEQRTSMSPELTTVNMFWNDLPALIIDHVEYVRLVDIHRQVRTPPPPSSFSVTPS